MIIDEPFDNFSLLKLDSLCNSSRKIDIPLFTFFTLNTLNFGWISQEQLFQASAGQAVRTRRFAQRTLTRQLHSGTDRQWPANTNSGLAVDTCAHAAATASYH